MAQIRLEHVTKDFGTGEPVVDDVNLGIEDGEFVILVGPSGSGKSTILRMIVGLEDITSGDVFIADKRVNDKAPRDRNLAMVFQNYALYPHLTVFENIAFPLRLHKVPDDEVRRRVEEATRLLELEELFSQYLDTSVTITMGPNRGRVGIDFADLEDLERIYRRITSDADVEDSLPNGT